GQTPADYLASWRVSVAQGMLRSGRPLKHVAMDVGYGSTSAFARVFERKVGQLPSVWLKQQVQP
uniref:helix-turn-helix domain-containing protein n=1 Tax=Aquabacterium sp. UBA2148 TaxID=1946042 RepID=UPI00257CC127